MSRPTNARRLVILTTDGPVPVTNAYSGFTRAAERVGPENQRLPVGRPPAPDRGRKTGGQRPRRPPQRIWTLRLFDFPVPPSLSVTKSVILNVPSVV